MNLLKRKRGEMSYTPLPCDCNLCMSDSEDEPTTWRRNDLRIEIPKLDLEDFSWTMYEAHESPAYVNRNAVTIQKLYRGYRVRSKII